MRSVRSIAPAVLVSAALVVGATASFAPPADAASKTFKFATFYFDQPGKDTPVTQTKLNREYVQVKNISRSTQTMTGYLIHDKGSKHTFRFPSGFKLGAGKTVTVHSGKGKASSTNLYWGMSKSMVWNNTGDTAYLVKGKSTVTTCSYTETSSQKKKQTGSKSC